MYLPIVLNSCPTKLSGVQFARPILPPGLQTRASSLAALSWSGVNITPNVDMTKLKSYRLQVRRFIFGVAAMVMSTLTIGALVVLPASIESESPVSPVLVAHSVIGTCEAGRLESEPSGRD